MRHEDWSFDSLLLSDQDVVVKLLAVASLDAQVVISEFTREGVSYDLFMILILGFLCRLLG